MASKKFFNFKENRPWAQNLQIVMQIGLTMAGSIIFCMFVGRLIDGWLGTGGIFTIIFILFGIIGGAIVVYRQIMEVLEPDSDKDKENNDRRE
ncbi:MAG: AtpZ/AtpI family protein [Desulfobacteraceae bacterium]|nr:AtpZ/AtpI family protein [Desulfobacteraceae bacterium]